jgi:hypothetical protein
MPCAIFVKLFSSVGLFRSSAEAIVERNCSLRRSQELRPLHLTLKLSDENSTSVCWFMT